MPFSEGRTGKLDFELTEAVSSKFKLSPSSLIAVEGREKEPFSEPRGTLNKIEVACCSSKSVFAIARAAFFDENLPLHGAELSNDSRHLPATSSSIVQRSPPHVVCRRKRTNKWLVHLYTTGVSRNLYGAIAQKLASGCHYERGTKFYLEGQSAVLQKKSLPIKFKLAIEAPEPRTGERNLRHEIRIEVLENRAAEYELSLLS